MRKSVTVAIALAVLGLGLAGLRAGTVRGASGAAREHEGPADARTRAADVKVDNFTFGPATLTVPVGTKVTWTNRDDIPHTVVSTDRVFKSKVLDTDETFSFTFSKPGRYEYFCSVHPRMTGRVVVQ